jgi:hypothetical protein
MVSRMNGHGALPAWLITLTLISGGGCAAKRPARSFSDLQQRLHSGNTVYVIDNTGNETKGKIVDVSPSALILDVNGIRRRMEEDGVRQVQRYGDSLWNGFFIGMAVAIPGLLIADPTYDRCENDPGKLCANAQAGQRVLALGIMGAVGAGIDALIRGRHQVYLAPGQPLQPAARIAVSPRLGPSAAGLFVTMAFNKSAMTQDDGATSTAEHLAFAPSRLTFRVIVSQSRAARLAR